MFLLLIITALSIDTIASIRKQISNKQYNAAYQAANSMITSQGILDADSILFFLRGCSAVKIGKYSQSINDLSRFLRTGTNINPKDQKEALVLRGTAYLKIGNLEDAKNDAESSKDESLMKLVKKASFLLNSAQSNDYKIAALDQLNEDMDDHTIICLRNHIPFHLDRENDIDIYEEIGNEIRLTINSRENDEYYVDFMMTADNNDATYKKFYMWDNVNDEPLPYSVINPGELDLNIYDDDTVNDRFDFDTACYFHIGDNNPYRNSIHHITKFHRELMFKHILTNLQCEVAASFATQSNHNLIGRTNEAYTPIKYYKLNDNDDKFWIELYDRNEIDIPVAFEDFFVFTMDVVLLQNRKLIYS